MEAEYYSVRMRAACRGEHRSGAERVVLAHAVVDTAAALLKRAFSGEHPDIDQASCQVEKIASEALCFARLPDVSTYQVDRCQQGRTLARHLLCRAGVAADVASAALQLLARGAGPDGRIMRGGVLMDATSGRRLEGDPARGVRVSRMDVAPEFRETLQTRLSQSGLEHFRVREALVLAGKVLGAPGLVAELCWSDDPTYQAGYVAAPGDGYQRITALKETGDPRGGRVFFIRAETVSLAELIDYLERTPVLFTGMGQIHPARRWNDDELAS